MGALFKMRCVLFILMTARNGFTPIRINKKMRILLFAQ